MFFTGHYRHRHTVVKFVSIAVAARFSQHTEDRTFCPILQMFRV